MIETVLHVGAVVWMVTMAPAGPDTDRPHLCWVTAVKHDPAGVRVYFGTKGGPRFVSRSDGSVWVPNVVQGDIGRADVPFLKAKLGDELFPQNSHHDRCGLKVVEKDGHIGVQAEASVSLPGSPISTASEFILATK